jgi:uncharacterized RDD family membrane protein YckC
VAAVVDLLLLSVAFAIMAYLLGVLQRITARAVVPPAMLSLMTVFASWVYFAGSESSQDRATFGKKVLRIVVTDVRGQRLSFARATARYFTKSLLFFIPSVLYLLYHLAPPGSQRLPGTVAWWVLLIGFALFISPRQGQMFWDFLCGSRVVGCRDATPIGEQG